jgi:hypothetical protein
LGIDQELLCLNRAGGKITYVDSYDEETNGLVANIYQKDIEIFGYTFLSNSLLNN